MSVRFRAYFYNDPTRIPMQKDGTDRDQLINWIIDLLVTYPHAHGCVFQLKEEHIATIDANTRVNIIERDGKILRTIAPNDDSVHRTCSKCPHEVIEHGPGGCSKCGCKCEVDV